MDLFKSGFFKLHSGCLSQWKIDCDALSDADIKTLAQMAYEKLPQFGEVIGVPRGGLRFAQALRKYSIEDAPRLIADDVLTTGNSAMELMTKKDDIGIVIFAREKPPPRIKAIFYMDCDC